MRALALLGSIPFSLVALLARNAAGQPATPGRTPPATDSSRQLSAVRVVESPAHRRALAGTVDLLDARTLRQSRVLTTNEALRKIPGVHVRDEEGLGLRPNIGVRGLNPTRSTKVLLLEDGVPLAIAPYGDPASYYHPPIDRFAEVEVVKGASQVRYGPQTIGGVINYLTPPIPDEPTGRVLVAPGGRRLLNLHLQGGGRFGTTGVLVDAIRKQGEGARANSYSELTDFNAKLELPLVDGQSIAIRANHYGERSQVTYSGLTEAEWAVDPLQNPFANDRMLLDRGGVVIAHRLGASAARTLTTTGYFNIVQRDWWRQSSNSAQRPNDRSDPVCAGMSNLLTTCGNEGRLRGYRVVGIEPRATLISALGGWAVRTDVGARAHFEQQERRQVHGDFPTARTVGAGSNVNSGVVEDNRRETAGYATFGQLELTRGMLTLSPGLRLEHVRLHRENRRPTASSRTGVEGSTALTQLIPGIGVTLQPSARLTLFSGLHRGFAPPRPEDVIDNSSGGVVELAAEMSWNAEVGARVAFSEWGTMAATLFRMDFANQIIPASVAGGTGATLTSAGATLHEGGELSLRLGPTSGARTVRPFLDLATTWLPVARFAGPRAAYVGTGGSDVVDKVYAEQGSSGTRTRVDVSRNRLPYAPTWMHTATIGLSRGEASDLRLEAVHLSDQFGDALNTRRTVADGQQGIIPASLILNVTANAELPRVGGQVYVTVKNLTDRRYIVDRTRGLLPGLPRLLQAGVTRSF